MADDEPPPPNPHRALIGLIAILAMVGAVMFVMYRLHQSAELQDCLASGRSNCMPIETHH